MSEFDREDGVSRRKVLECMTWVGTGVLWTVTGGVPHSLGIIGEAAAQEARGLTFLQISDSHVGFDKPANPNALGTLEEAVARINAKPKKSSFMIHTGDISHLSKVSEFDDADRIISQTRLDVHYVPGEHDFLDEEQKLYRERYGRGAKGAGWYSFDANGVHFIGLVNVVDLKAGGLGNLGAEQLAWLEADLKGRSASAPIVVFAHIPLWTVYPEWGWGTEDGARAQRPHSPGDAEGRRQRHFPHSTLDRVSAAGTGHRRVARTDESRRRQAAHHARHRQYHLQTKRAAARDHRHAACGLRRKK
jgi:3',5'-cyclic AMP phosphodiesterase CpdA